MRRLFTLLLVIGAAGLPVAAVAEPRLSRVMKRPVDDSDLIQRVAALPVLLVRGERELGMPEQSIAALAARLPRLTLSRYHGAGHLTFFEQPQRFNSELAGFVAAAKTSP